MIRGLLGKKIGMTQIFDTDGNVVPVTALEAGPCYVLALQDAPLKVKVGFEEVRETRVKKNRSLVSLRRSAQNRFAWSGSFLLPTIKITRSARN